MSIGGGQPSTTYKLMPRLTNLDEFISHDNILEKRPRTSDVIVGSTQMLQWNQNSEPDALILPWITLAGLMLIPKSAGKTIDDDTTTSCDELTNYELKKSSNTPAKGQNNINYDQSIAVAMSARMNHSVYFEDPLITTVGFQSDSADQSTTLRNNDIQISNNF